MNSSDTTRQNARYSTVAIWLHWIMALLIIGNLIGGLTVDSLFPGKDAAAIAGKSLVIGLHKSIGLTIILLTIVRIGWRLVNVPPPLPAHMTRIEILGARLTHIGFYGLMLALPLSGWAMVSTARTQYPLLWFKLFEVPKLPLSRDLGGVFHESHEILGWVMVALLALHVLAAVKHQIMDRDNLLARMSPFGGKREG